MKIYTISELETMNKEQIKQIVQERGDLLVGLVSEVFSDKKIKVFINKKDKKRDSENLLKLSNVTLKRPTEHLEANNAVLLFLQMDIKQSKPTNQVEYSSEIATSQMNSMVEKVIDSDARILWTVDKIAKKNMIEMRLLFPDNLIVPDLVLYQEYKTISKKAKKADKENFKVEFQSKLDIAIEELKAKPFNLMRNNCAYFPEDRSELMDFIGKANARFDKQAVKNVIKKYPEDKEIITACIFLFNESLFKYVSPTLKNDREFILSMVDKNCSILEYGLEKYLDDDKIMNKAINIMGYMIRIASNRLKQDKEFCLTAINNQAAAYGVLPENMRADNDLLMAAMNQRGEFLMYSPEVRTNKPLLLKAFSNAFPPQSRNLLQLTSDEFKNDKEIALAAIKCNPENLWGISKELREQIGDNDPVEYLTKQVAEIHNIKNSGLTNSDTTPVKIRKKKM